MTVAITEAMTTGLNWATAKSPRINSNVNRAPAIGALKVAAMPAAATHPTSVRMRRTLTLKTCPRVDPIAAPICATGPFRPTNMPVPILMAEASDFTSTTRGRIRPPRSATASITSGTPCPFASRAPKYTSGPTIAPPIAGMSIL